MIDALFDDEDGGEEPKRSLEDWRRYVDGIGVAELAEVTENANSVGFVRALQDRGYDASEIHQILVLFAQRFRALGQVPPPGGYVDLDWLADNP